MNNEAATATPPAPEKKPEPFHIYGMPWYYFAVFSAAVLAATYLGRLPEGMIGAFSLMIVIGTVLGLAGDRTPIVNTFLGGGAIVIIFGSAAVNTFKLVPPDVIQNMDQFMKGGGFLDFYIAALITGSIMGMNRRLLIQAALRYLPCILGAVAVALAVGTLFGALIGYGARDSLYFIAIPVMGGGMGAGAVPLAKIFGEGLGRDPAAVLSVMVPAVALGNAVSIVLGGLLDRLGKARPSLTGNGQLMKVRPSGPGKAEAEEDTLKSLRDRLNLVQMGTGLFVSTCFFAFGSLVNLLLPAVHGYAWMIIAVAAVKISGLLPQKFEICCYQWFQFVMTNLTGVLLVGIGIAFTDLNAVASAFSVQYFVLVLVIVLGAMVGAAVAGRLVGFYLIEASITSGLCMTNMGGTGDVAVLSAAKRMELMPFSQISSRIGGALMLIIASVLLKIVG